MQAQAADARFALGPTVHSPPFTQVDANIADCRHLYFYGVKFVSAGEPFHCERCVNLLLKGCEREGAGATLATLALPAGAGQLP